MPSEKLLTEMGNFNEELVKAGVMLAGEGLHPSSKAKRVRFSGGQRIVTDGPFAETKELIAGFWLWQVKSIDEAVDSRLIRRVRPMIRRSRFVRCSRRKSLAKSTRPSSARRKTVCAQRSRIRRSLKSPGELVTGCGGYRPPRFHLDQSQNFLTLKTIRQNAANSNCRSGLTGWCC